MVEFIVNILSGFVGIFVNETFLRISAFLIVLLIEEILSDILLLNYKDGKIKFKWGAKGNLNPFIKHDKALGYWFIQIILAAVFSNYLFDYFQNILAIQPKYNISVFFGTISAMFVLGVRQLNIKLSERRRIYFIISILISIVSWYVVYRGYV